MMVGLVRVKQNLLGSLQVVTKVSFVSNEKLDELYFNYLGSFKIAIIVLNVTPYIALKLMLQVS
ncbi:DUF6868 family protein [Bermanella sp. R86510]|uniref:DUF6868 family protein n=1 Tax=unclassified Bermanella TaxID=2627862 RepID=UPI0037C60121